MADKFHYRQRVRSTRIGMEGLQGTVLERNTRLDGGEPIMGTGDELYVVRWDNGDQDLDVPAGQLESLE